MSRPRDLAFETLAEVTNTDWDVGRGQLNDALAAIRSQFDDEEFLPDEIRARARLYRSVFPGAALTPSALKNQWSRVIEEANAQSRQQATNVSAPWNSCQTCSGHGFVVYATRPMPETFWMKQHGFKSKGEIEEWAACPDCSKVDATYRTFDGSMFRPPDPAQVRERIAR